MVSSVVLSPVDEIKDGDRFDPYLASFDNKRRHAAPLLSIAATQREDAKRRKKAFDAREMELAKSIKQRSVFARVENSRLLIINTTPKALRDIYSDAKTSGVRRNAPAFNTDVLNSGPGTPITYGKEHILCHPEIEWVHRGQGRYLPASDIQKDMPPPAAGRMSRQSKGQLIDSPASLLEDADGSPMSATAEGVKPSLRRASSSFATTTSARRRRKTTEEALTDSLTPSFPSYGLRQRRSEPETPTLTEMRSPRLTSRTRASAGLRRVRRTTSYNDPYGDGSEQDESEGSAESVVHRSTSGDETYRRETVEALPENERKDYYHAGNGWYKKGTNPRDRNIKPKARDVTDNVIEVGAGVFVFDRSRTVHQSQLDKFPGEEFHHCGNGWYKAGPSDYRSSIHVPHAYTEFDAEKPAMGTATSSQAAADQIKLPGIDREANGIILWDSKKFRRWQYLPVGHGSVHKQIRNGEYSSDAEQRSEDVNKTFDKVYVDMHPEEDFHHTGNGRYKRGLRADGKIKPKPQSPPPDEESLYTKQYVNAHPQYEFHHRGQGRWKFGPRDTAPAAPRAQRTRERHVRSGPAADGGAEEEEEEEEEEESDAEDEDDDAEIDDAEDEDEEEEVDDESDEDEDEIPESTRMPEVEPLVDTAYVDAHPLETFHHRGQGRWARGLPPFGSSRKMAIRGPGAADRSAQEESVSSTRSVSQGALLGPPPPPRSTLLTKSEGPEKWPEVTWHYRGGGKWSQLSREEWDAKAISAFVPLPKDLPAHRGRKGKPSTRMAESAAAQLDRETIAATVEHECNDKDIDFAAGDCADEFLDQSSRYPKPKIRGKSKRLMQAKPDATKPSYKSTPSFTTPKPAMLTVEEDRLTEADLPDLYREDYSPSVETDLDGAERLYRLQFRPLDVDTIIAALEKHDPATRTLESLKSLAENAQLAMQSMQDEFLELERLTAPHAKIPRRPAQGGRKPLDHETYEDRKEADLYDYTFDPRKIGYQDPTTQRIVRDDQGRQLRKNRRTDLNGSVPGWNLDGEGDLAPKRASRQPQRFDGTAAPAQTRKRARTAQSQTRAESAGAGSMTPDRAATPVQQSQDSNGNAASASGRWAGHVPKRIRELRGDSAGSTRSEGGSEAKIRKGRPPGSKNLHARKDKGVKKGPRKPKAERDPISVAFDEMFGENGYFIRSMARDQQERGF